MSAVVAVGEEVGDLGQVRRQARACVTAELERLNGDYTGQFERGLELILEQSTRTGASASDATPAPRLTTAVVE